MDSETLNKILHQYDQQIALYSDFARTTNELIIEILRANKIESHSVSWRAKNRSSFETKLTKPDSSYSQLADITDLAAVRIITFFSDDVDSVASLIEQEFEIDKENSVDKRRSLDPDRFGYLSMHHVATLSAERLKLTEYKKFPNLKVEIQTRTILQHAWAEIEHDLGYKSNIAVPKRLQRKFSRLAGLLELADEQFLSIREEISTYKAELALTIPTIPYEVAIDRDSLLSFIKINRSIAQIDIEISKITNGILKSTDLTWLERLIPRLQQLGFKTIGDLQNAIDDNSKYITPFARKWLEGHRTKLWNMGITLFYLCYVLLAKMGDENLVLQYLNSFVIGAPENRANDAKKVKRVFDAISRK